MPIKALLAMLRNGLQHFRADQTGRRLTELREFMAMELGHWNENLAREPTLGAAQYNQAWAMVHFLIFSPDPARAKSILHSTEPGAKEKTAKGKSADWFPLPKALGDPSTSNISCDVSSSRFHYDIDMK